MANTVVYQEEWETRLQERLDHPTNWEDLLEVIYTDTQVIRRPYLSTTPAVQTSQTRGTAYTFQDFGTTSEAITISSFEILPIFIDRADLAQSTYADQMYMAELQGQLIKERLEAAFGGQHASWTDHGTGSLAGGSGAASDTITVTANNIDDIIRSVKRRIYAANGLNIALRNGIGFEWRPADYEYLEAFAQANGFQVADLALKNGIPNAFHYFGVDNYITNDNTANHLFAGVKKAGSVGILSSTYGQVIKVDEPNIVSGVGLVARLDYAFAWWNNMDSLYYDVNVA